MNVNMIPFVVKVRFSLIGAYYDWKKFEYPLREK